MIVVYSYIYNKTKFLPEILFPLAKETNGYPILISDNFLTDDSLVIVKSFINNFKILNRSPEAIDT